MWIIIGMCLLLIPTTVVYLRYKAKIKDTDFTSVILKDSCTTIIIFAALAGLIVKGEGVSVFDWLVITGLVFGLIGDSVIGFSFLGGMIAFEIGHLCYMVAMLSAPGNHIWAVPIWAAVCAALFFIYKKYGIDVGKYKEPVFIYAAVILMMLSLTFTVRETCPLLLPAAALLFTVSDFILAMTIFGIIKSIKIQNYSFWLYLTGQSLFAVSVILGL